VRKHGDIIQAIGGKSQPAVSQGGISIWATGNQTTKQHQHFGDSGGGCGGGLMNLKNLF
jgi:hypothetical protein